MIQTTCKLPNGNQATLAVKETADEIEPLTLYTYEINGQPRLRLRLMESLHADSVAEQIADWLEAGTLDPSHEDWSHAEAELIYAAGFTAGVRHEQFEQRP